MNWGEIEEVIFGISSFNWLVVLLLSLFAQYRNLDFSIRITLFLWVVFDLITLIVTPLIFGLSEIDKELTRLVWYISFAFIALTQMIAMGYLHLKMNIPKSDMAKFAMFILLCSIIINVTRLIDRCILDTNVLMELYRYGTMSLKIFALAVFVKYVAKNKGVSFAN